MLARLFVVASLLMTALTGCAPDNDQPKVIRVPQDAPTIQAGLDDARPGSLVLVSPGVYRESVIIITERVVLRGVDRNRVVVDGEFARANGIVVNGAGSAVENLTVRSFLANGVLFTGVTDRSLQGAGAGGHGYDPLDTARFPALRGFRASHVTAYNNALYGIYSFDARDGVIEHSYASGHADSGIYVGQCNPCNTAVRDNLVEHNAVGIEVTNASDGLWFLGNRMASNRVGMTLNSNDFEALAPQHNAVVIGNVIAGNNDDRSPEQADGGFGIGLGIGGGSRNTLSRNRITGNAAAGILITDVPGYAADGNTCTGNVVIGNGADLVVTAVGKSNALNGKILAAPAKVKAPPGVDFRMLPRPAQQPQLPDAISAPARPAIDLPGPVDATSYPLP